MDCSTIPPTIPPEVAKAETLTETAPHNNKIRGRRKDRLGEGAAVVLFAGFGQLVYVPQLKAGKITNMKIGNFHHDDIIGKAFGHRVKDRKSSRWVAVLFPTPHLLTDALTHRTQIIYQADIYPILMLIDAKPGDTVIETGTGSGSLTPHIALAVGAQGKVHTFEFHELRAREAKILFEQYKIDSIVTSHHRDVYSDGGFDLEDQSTTAAAAHPTNNNMLEQIENNNNRYIKPYADSAFIDLPQPWKALKQLRRALKPNGRVVTFSPCIEQIQKTERWLTENGFKEIRMFESLSKVWGGAKISNTRGRASRADANISSSNKKRRIDVRARQETEKSEEAEKNEEQNSNCRVESDLEKTKINLEENVSKAEEVEREPKRQKLRDQIAAPSDNEDEGLMHYEQFQYPMKGHTGYLLVAIAPVVASVKLSS